MGSHVVCVRPEVAVETLADQFHAAGAILLPVVDASARLIGVLWRSDLAPPSVRESAALRLRLRGESMTTVGEEMDPRAISVREDLPLSEALRAITSNRARTVTVVATDGTVVGLLSDLEILIWFALERRRTRP